MAAEDTSLNGTFVPKGVSIMFSSLAINRKAVWVPIRRGSGRYCREVRRRGRAAAALRSDYGFLASLVGPGGCVGSVAARMEFKFLLAACCLLP